MFTRLNKDHKLVETLKGKTWWEKIVELSHTDRDINIQLRADYINVYSKMGNLLKISYKNGDIVCEIHYKYLIDKRKSEYIKFSPKNGGLRIDKNDNICPHIEDILKPQNLTVIKSNITIYAGEEKTIQSKLVEKNKKTIIDVEVAFFEKNKSKEGDENSNKNPRIDIVNFDKNRKKIVFIELKQIFDQRLYCDEIKKQIKRYYDFAVKNQNDIIEAYKGAIQAKIELGIIKDNSFLSGIEKWEIETKPLLVIAAYNQSIIDSLRKKIEDNLDFEFLSGLYFFGKDVDLNLPKDGMTPSKNKR